MINKIPADIIAVADKAVNLPNAAAVYLFGSQVAGATHQDSDVDIGIFAPGSSLTERDIYRRLPTRTATGRAVDYRLLDSTKSPAFLSRVVIKGTPVKVKNETQRADFESLVLRMWNDWQFKLKIQEHYQRKFLNRRRRRFSQSGSPPLRRVGYEAIIPRLARRHRHPFRLLLRNPKIH